MQFDHYLSALKSIQLVPQLGRLIAIHGVILEATGCKVQHGELVKITHARTGKISQAEVVGLKDGRIFLMPYGEIDGLCLDSTVSPTGDVFLVPVGNNFLGRVVNALGQPIDDKGAIQASQYLSSHGQQINPLSREPISDPLITGVRAIDVFTPLGKGQRIGIFAGSGVGKSTLLGMIAKSSDADIIVIALIGERGREVGDFIRQNIKQDGMHRSVLVVATAADPAVMRRQAAFTATSIAEWFRSQGKNVLLIMDSITRFAMAQREIAISIGEPMGTRGYPSSALALLPPLIERAGNIYKQGSISAIYTVLVEGDDFNEPISDNMRSILDGHVMLDRSLVSRAHFPAIDVLTSISRLGKNVISVEKQKRASRVKQLIAIYDDSKEMIEMGLYTKGSNSDTDLAISLKDEIAQFLMQSDDDFSEGDYTWSKLDKIWQKSIGVVR